MSKPTRETILLCAPGIGPRAFAAPAGANIVRVPKDGHEDNPGPGEYVRAGYDHELWGLPVFRPRSGQA